MPSLILPAPPAGSAPSPPPSPPQNPRPRLRAAQEPAGLPLSHMRARATDPRGAGSPAALSSDHHLGQLRRSGRPTGLRGPLRAGRPRTQHGPLCLGVPGTVGGMEHCGGHLSSFTAERLIYFFIDWRRGSAGGGGPRLGGGGDAFAKDTKELHPGRPVATPAPLSIPPTPPSPQPRPRGPPLARGEPRAKVWRQPTRCARRKREGGETGRPRREEAGREAGSERPAAAPPGRVGKGRPGSGTSGYLTPDGESRSRRNTKKPGRSLAATRSPRPAPSAPLAEQGSRRSANFISQRPNSRRAKAAAPGPSPTLLLLPIALSSFQK